MRRSRLRLLAAPLLLSLVAALAPSAVTARTVNRTSYLFSATYVVHINLDWGTGALDVTTDMEADNQSGGKVSRLELNSLAARLGNIKLLEFTVDGAPVTPKVHDQTISVPLPVILGRHDHVSVHSRYQATLLDSVAGHDWLWAQKDGVASVYRAIPWLSARKSFERDNIGDPFVTPVASSVRVTFTSSPGVVFATSGVKVASAEPGVTYVAYNVRDFNFTASRDYVTSSSSTLDGQTHLRLLTRWASAATQRHILDVARRAIAQYDRWVGQLPCHTLTIAQTAGGSAMESPCLIWIPRNAGAGIDYLVAHELGHQWFYGVVGNDQAADPFLDEGMTDFLARTFLHQFRASKCPKDTLDKSIYEYVGNCYYEVIYIQGSEFLNTVKSHLGAHLFWATLQIFWADHAYTVATSAELLDAFRVANSNQLLPGYHQQFPSLYPWS